MTIAELDALAARYFPSEMTPAKRNAPEEGRASVTLLRSQERNTSSIEEVFMPWYRSEKAVCPICKKEFPLAYGVRQTYCSNACKQKAYRQRKKALRAGQAA